jgi:DNA-binding LacI/PurR family transcriptional regulator
MANPKARVTVAEIARQLELGTSTVAHVLNGRGDELRIRAETQERVLQMARELGYRLNSSARAMRTGRFGSVSLIQPSNAIFLPAGMMLGLIRELHEHDLHLTMSEAPDMALSDAGFLPKVVRELSVDGLLINMAGKMPPTFLNTLQSLGIPAIWINSKQAHDAVYPDDFQAAFDLTRHLLGMGHHHIVYAAPRLEASTLVHYSEADRRAGYEAAMEKAQQKTQCVAIGAMSHDPEIDRVDKRQETARHILEAVRPSAVIAYEVETALPLYHAARDLGWRVPQQLSIAMFHSDVERFSGVGFTTMCNMAWNWGSEAARMLIERIEHPQQPLPARPLPPWLDIGRTCAPPP